MKEARALIETKAALAVAVDLTPFRPDGSHGGLKPALFRLLSEAMEQAGRTLVFLFLANAATRDEVRRLARPQDLLICVEPDGPPPEAPLEFWLPDPPSDFLRWIGADLLYAPLGACSFACEGVPTVALIADLLHRDYPLSLTQAQIAERDSSIMQTLFCASMIQCASRAGVERLMAHYQVPEEKLFYTYLPMRECREADSAATDFIQDQGPYFFYPADLWKHKNHETLLLAYRLYREQAGEAAWDLVLAFHEENRAAELRTLARALGIEPLCIARDLPRRYGAPLGGTPEPWSFRRCTKTSGFRSWKPCGMECPSSPARIFS